MKLIVNGHAQHGKDYLSDLLAKELGMRKLNASMFFSETVMLRAFPGQWTCVEDCYLDRVNHRALWYQMMRMGDWQKRLMEISDIFCGHRNISEHVEMSFGSSEPYLRVWVEWEGKPAEPASSSQWQQRSDIEAHHDLLLTHNGDGADHMVAAVKEAMK